MGLPAAQFHRYGVRVLNFAPKKSSLVIEFDLVQISSPGISFISLLQPDSIAQIGAPF